MKAIIIKAVTPPTVEEVNWAANYKGNFYVPDESVDVYKADANYANIVSRIKGINSFVTDHPDSGVEDLVYG